MYNIDNCGYAVCITKCPNCYQDIGGSGHKHLPRVHRYLSYEEIDKAVKEYVSGFSKEYNPHPRVTKQSDEYMLVRLLDLSMQKI